MTFLERSLEHIIVDQPAALRDTFNWLRDNMEYTLDFFSKLRRVYLVGCGDSYFVALYGALLFENLTSIEAFAYESYEFLKYKRNLSKNDALIAISASGSTSKTVDAASYASKKGLKIVALTNYEDSPLSRLAHVKLITQVRNPYGPPAATSTTAMYVLNIIARRIGGSYDEEIVKRIPNVVKEFIDDSLSSIDSSASTLSNYSRVYLVGAGASYIPSLFGGAKLREATWMHSIIFEAEEFSHYGMMSIDENDLVIINAPKGKSLSKLKEVSDALNEIGAKQIILTNSINKNWNGSVIKLPDLDEFDNAITSTPYYQILAVKTAIKKGLKVNGFRYSSILTKLIKYYE